MSPSKPPKPKGSTKQPKLELRSRVRFSIASRLNMRLWFRLLGIFLLLDIILCTAAFVTTIYYAENVISHLTLVKEEVEQGQWDNEWLTALNIRIEPIGGQPQGFTLPSNLQRYVGKNAAGAARSLEFSGLRGGSLWQQLEQLNYRVEFVNESLSGYNYAVIVELASVISWFKKLAIIIIIIQGLMLIRSIFKQARTIRNTLTPLTELAEKAQILQTDKGPFTPEEMQELAGKLDGINAARLDTRIELEDTQDELRNLASAINGMLDRINESYHLQARFVSDASHELRTPIAAIQGYVNLLDRWGKNDEKALQESIDAIKEEATNMKELIEQLLFLARGDSHRMPLHLERIDVANVAQAVFKETEMISGGHDFESQLKSAFVYADNALIKQALRILVDNAIKYTPIGGRIVISSERVGTMAHLVVQDNGIGIPPDAVPRIFDRFYRADESRARKTGGTGLGLSIAKWISDRHGGHMEVLSRQDLGTRITIVIPAITVSNTETDLIEKQGSQAKVEEIEERLNNNE